MTLSHWNPATPNRVGLEYAADLAAGSAGGLQLLASTGILQTMRGEAADSVTGAEIWRTIAAPTPVNGFNNNFAVWLAEVFADGDEDGVAEADWSAWTQYLPNGDGTIDTGWTDEIGNATNLYQSIDDATPSTADFIIFAPVAGGSGGYEMQLNTGAASFSSKRIQIRVNITAVDIESLLSGSGASHTLTIGFTTNTGTTICEFAQISSASPQGETFTFDLPEINPLTGLYWTQADVRAFDAASRITIESSSIAAGKVGRYVIYGADMEVRSVNENRVAFGFIGETAAATSTLASLGISQPASASAWSKANATSYAVVIRRMYLGTATLGYIRVDDGTTNDTWAPVSPTMHYLEGPNDPGWTDYQVAKIGVGDRGVNDPQAVTAYTAIADGAVVRVVWTTAGADTDDGSPYSLVREEPVSTTLDLEQEISSPANASFDGGAVCIRYNPAARPTSDLTVEVRRMSDNNLHGTATVTVDDIDSADLIGASSWKIVSFELSSVTALVSGTDYSIEFSSSTPDALPYLIQLLNTDPGVGEGHEESTFGSFEGATIDGVLADGTDVVAYLFDGPTPPASLAAAGGSIDAGWSDLDRISIVYCPPTLIPYMAISWTATALGGIFVSYTIQRRDDIDPVWRTIATLTTEATASFDDYEARISIDTDYRIRATSDYGGGAWSEILDKVIESSEAALLLTSNADRSQTVAVLDTYSQSTVQPYQFAEANRAVVMPIHGRDRPVVFIPTERSGAEFARQVIVDVIDPAGPTPPGPYAYTTLRDMAMDPDLTYVCVRDGRGNRWLATVLIPNVSPETVNNAHAVLTAEMRVIESTIVPAVASS